MYSDTEPGAKKHVSTKERAIWNESVTTIAALANAPVSGQSCAMMTAYMRRKEWMQVSACNRTNSHSSYFDSTRKDRTRTFLIASGCSCLSVVQSEADNRMHHIRTTAYTIVSCEVRNM